MNSSYNSVNLISIFNKGLSYGSLKIKMTTEKFEGIEIKHNIILGRTDER